MKIKYLNVSTFIFCFYLTSCARPALEDLEFSPVLTKVTDIETIEKDEIIQSFKDNKTNLIGFKEKNKVIISPQYISANEFNKYGIADVLLPTSIYDWYKINKKGKRLVKSYFFDNGPDYYVANLSRYESNGKVGFVNLKGEIVIPAQFDWASTFSFSVPISIVCIGCLPKEIDPSHDGCYHTRIQGGKWGIIDKQGKLLIPLEFTDYNIENSTVTMFKDTTKYKLYYSIKGKLVLIK